MTEGLAIRQVDRSSGCGTIQTPVGTLWLYKVFAVKADLSILTPPQFLGSAAPDSCRLLTPARPVFY